MKQPTILAKSAQGFIRIATCACCFHIRFERFFWRMSQRDFQQFCHYIAELNSEIGFAQNEVEPGLALVTMAKERQGAFFTRQELGQLEALLDQGQIQLARQQLENQFRLG